MTLGSFKVRSDAKERKSGVRRATGSYRAYSVPDKTATLVPEFAVEDLPSAKLQPRFGALPVKDLPLGRKTDDDDDDDYPPIYVSASLKVCFPQVS